jgi:prepilin signal peptidase PulO-like enzyme (type II secretory pathway)
MGDYTGGHGLVAELCSAFAGILLGSLAGFCAYRMPRGIPLLGRRPFCPACGSSLCWYEIIPLASFFLLRGQCKSCRIPIPLQDLVAEATTGLLMFYSAGRCNTAIDLALAASFFLVLQVVAISDWEFLKIPNAIVSIGALSALGLGAAVSTDTACERLVSGLLAGSIMVAVYVVGALLFRREAMGVGDIKLGAMLGCFLGVVAFLVSLWFAAALGAAFGPMTCSRRHAGDNYVASAAHGRVAARNCEIPFGMFLCISSAAVFLFSDSLLPWLASILE